MEELMNLDKEFSVERFKSYVSNIFVQITLAITFKDIEKVKHFMSIGIFQKLNDELENLNKNNFTKLYDELNIANVDIIEAKVKDDSYLIYVNILSKSMDYIIDSNTKKYISGNNTRRTDKKYSLIFEKNKNANIQHANRICPNCGANIDVNQCGKCSYCGSIYNLSDFDWILIDIKEIF